MSGRLSTWLAAALALGACGCTIGSEYRVYGVDLETRDGARAFLWPDDDVGTVFRYVVEDADVSATEVRVLRTRDADFDLGVGFLAGATVALPPCPSRAVRSGAEATLDRIAAVHPGLSTHVVVTAVEWSDVRTYEEYLDRARRAREIANPEPDGSAVLEEFFMALCPTAIVVPRADSEEFLVSCSSETSLLFAPRFGEYGESAAAIGGVIDTLHAAVTEDVQEHVRWVVLVVPGDADDACRSRCDELMLALVHELGDRWTVMRRTAREARAAEFADPAAIPALLGPLGFASPFDGESPEAQTAGSE